MFLANVSLSPLQTLIACVLWFDRAQVVGWPPIRSFRKNTMASHPPKTNEDAEAKLGFGCLYVKVSMDGAPYLRKVDLKTYCSYMDLSSALEKMFSCFTIGNFFFLIYPMPYFLSRTWYMIRVWKKEEKRERKPRDRKRKKAESCWDLRENYILISIIFDASSIEFMSIYKLQWRIFHLSRARRLLEWPVGR